MENFIVISGNDVMEYEDNEIPVYGESQHGAEQDYREYLESVQSLIEFYENTGKCPEVDIATYFDNPDKNRELQKTYFNFKHCFFEGENQIRVKRLDNGLYKICGNGRHRLYCAKKYGLKVIVQVIEKKECP